MPYLRKAAVMAAAAAMLVVLIAPASGATTPRHRRPFFEVRVANLAPVAHDPTADGGSSTSGKVLLIRFGDHILVTEFLKDASANLPHAQHIHGIGLGQCPGPERAGADGLISTPEALPDYGAIQASLTTTGDTSPASALAVDRFPTANRSGFVLYARVLRIGTDIPAAVGYNLADYEIVVHGIDVNHNGVYDFGAGPSPLDPSLPLEATVPAACGQIN